MRVLAVKPGHDGAIAFLDGRTLVFSHESQVDSFARHSDLSIGSVLSALELVPDWPDIIAVGGWQKVVPGSLMPTAAGYHGLALGRAVDTTLLGRPTTLFTSSHERSHVLCAIALSPFDPAGDIAVLVWEGQIGSLYRWEGSTGATYRYPVLDQPGARYAALFALSDPMFPDSGAYPNPEYAGKLMALAALADDRPPDLDSEFVVQSLLRIRALYPFHKERYRASSLYNCGVTHPEVARAARLLSDSLFGIFLDAARRHLARGMPLAISGGCGLNCEWNTRWRASGHFAQVFIPPCADDSGSAIGTGADALYTFTSNAKLDWSVFSGPAFVMDEALERHGWRRQRLDMGALAEALDAGEIVAWVQGRCEIGPRALGHRSLLASAAREASHERLNAIKAREPYRPIAPVCLEESLDEWFDSDEPDPHMLFFRGVRRPVQIPAVTHLDGSARVQSVPIGSAERIRTLLVEVRRRTGIPVLCNTSLNFSGRGFINRASELALFCHSADIRHIVIDDTWWSTEPPCDRGE